MKLPAVGCGVNDPNQVNTEQVKPELKQYTTEEVRSKIFRTDHLGTMPQLVLQIVEALGDERTTPESLSAIIEGDPALAAKLLSLANSAYYGQKEEVKTIARAIWVMGFNELQIMAVGMGLADVFDLKKLPPDAEGPGLWLHCLAVSWLAGQLAGASGLDPAEAMLGGLLHDLGKLFNITQMTKDYIAIMRQARNGKPYYHVEDATGLNHDLVGYWLAERWKLPMVYKAAVRDHHSPKVNDDYYSATSLIALANQAAKEMEFGVVHEAEALDKGVLLNAAGIKEEDLEKVKAKALEHIPAMMENWLRTFF